MNIHEWRNYWEEMGRIDLVQQIDEELAKQTPERESIIQEDEITNLKIDLGATNTVEEFLKRIENV